MFAIRPITAENARVIEKFMSDDLLGITSLPRNKHFLHQKLTSSLLSFSKKITSPSDEHYYFVLENAQTGEIGGICGIESKTGAERPVYSYRIEKIPAPETDLPVPRKQLILHVHAQTSGPSKIGSLYVLPAFRKEGLGRLLSLSRFLFMAAFPERFDSKVVAEMRGYVDEKNVCPFWEGLGKHFLQISFHDLMDLLESIQDSIPFITPQHPIYVSLLSAEAQEAIGRVHLDTQPALNLLMQEGFCLTDEIDLFDAGPKVEAPLSEIRTIKNSQTAIIRSLSHTAIESDRYLLGNESLNFCACYGHLALFDDNTATIPTEIGHLLNVGEGDSIRYTLASTKNSCKGQL